MTAVTSFFKNLMHGLQQSDTGGRAAEMAYHLMLSLFPTVIFVIGLLKYIGARFDLFDEMMPFLFRTVPKDMIPVVRDTVMQIVQGPTDTFAILGFLGFLWTASNGASALMKGICQAYQFDYMGQSTVKDRLLSILIIVVVATGLIIALNMLLFGNWLITWLTDHLNLSQWATVALHGFKIVMGLGGLLLSSVFIYTLSLKQLTPRIGWKQTLPGAITFVVLWILMSIGFKIYVEQFAHFNKVYGALGGVIILMTWLYLSAFVVLVGAEINALVPVKNVPVKKPALTKTTP